jgi:hypothetical protein
MTEQELKDQAWKLAEDGMFVFPVYVYPDPEEPGKYCKVPLCAGGHNSATSNPDEHFWGGRCNYVGIACEKSGIWVVDVDEKGALLEFPQSPTRFQVTIRGGYHYIYKAVPGIDQRNTTGWPAKGIDIRANGGYIVWYGMGECIEDDILPWPFGLLQRDGKTSGAGYQYKRVSSGGRNNDSISYAGVLMNQNPGMTFDHVLNALTGHSTKWHEPVLKDSELAQLANSALNLRTVRQARATASVELMSYDQVMQLPPVSWLIKGLFIAQGTNFIYGASGAGKSFIALEMCMAIAEGRPWHGRKTKQRPVVYIALEGQAGIRQRLNAWAKVNKRKPPGNFYVYAPQGLDMRNTMHQEATVAAIRKMGLIEPVLFVDTFAQAFPGIKENASEDMSVALYALTGVKNELEGSLIVAHHTGKALAAGLRGHSSMEGAADGAVLISREGDDRSWKATKVKDGADNVGATFFLEIIETDLVDEDGDPVTSCYIREGEARSGEEEQKPRLHGAQRKTLVFLHCMLDTKGVIVPKFMRPSVSHEDAIKYLMDHGIKKQSAQRGINSLVIGGHLAESDGRIFDPT